MLFDTDLDGTPDVDGRLVCVGRGHTLVVEDGDAVVGRLRVRFKDSTLLVSVPRQALLPHLDVVARTLSGASCEGGGACADLAPDLGTVKIY